MIVPFLIDCSLKALDSITQDEAIARREDAAFKMLITRRHGKDHVYTEEDKMLGFAAYATEALQPSDSKIPPPCPKYLKDYVETKLKLEFDQVAFPKHLKLIETTFRAKMNFD